MPDTAIESDPLFTLLTDALRAGPGSPQWSQAVAQIRARGAEGSEYDALITARDNLESGREYRTVRAGAGFTRKLFTRIDEQAESTGSGLPTTTWVAALSAVAIVVVLGLIAYLLIPGTEKPSPGLEQLTSTMFATPLQTLKFDGPLPAEWSPIGSLPLDTAHGLRASIPGTKATLGGGVYWTSPISADQPIAIEANVRVNRPVEDLTLQLFVTDKPDFSTDRGSSSHELVWQSKGPIAQVFLPSGLSEGQVERSANTKERTVRIIFNRDLAMIDMNGGKQRLWAGPNQLSPTQPRYVGIRLIRTGGEKSEAVVVTGLRVLKP